MILAAEWGTGQVLWSLLWLFAFVIWFWLLIDVFADISRSDDLSGWGKAGWVLLVIALPYLGVLLYFIARGTKMHEHAEADARQEEAAVQKYIRDAAGSTGSAAEEIARLANLRDTGVISDEEFQQGKAQALARTPSPRAPSQPAP